MDQQNQDRHDQDQQHNLQDHSGQAVEPGPAVDSLPAPLPPAAKQKRKRARTGCLTCRARKVKCDEARPLCKQCGHLGLPCQWQETAGASTPSRDSAPREDAGQNDNSINSGNLSGRPPVPSPLRRRAGQPACYTCRYARSRCSMTKPTCTRCQAYGHECTYPGPRNSRTLTATAQQWIARRQARAGAAPIPSTEAHETAQPQPDEDMLSPTNAGPSHHSPPQQTSQHHLATQERDEPRVSFPQRPYSHASDRPSISSRGERGSEGPRSIQSPVTSRDTASRASIDAFHPSATRAYSRPASPYPSSRHELPSQERIERLAVAFFQCVHVYRSNAFLHRDRALMAIRDETISTSILLAICAVGARFTSPPEPEEVARAWADDAGQRVMSASECSRETVAVALLLNIYSQQAMRFAQAHNWGAVAMNQAVTLGLHREVTPVRGIPTFDEAEGDRRLFFACYTINRFASNGQPAAVSCPTPCIKQRLPCDGFNYRLDVSVETPYALLEDDESHVPAWMYKNVGAMGFWVRLVGARFMVKQSFQAMMNAGQATTHEQDNEQPGTIEAPPTPGTSSSTLNPLLPWHPGSLFSASVAKLATIRESLPPRQRLHSGLLHRKRNTTGLGQIVMFYLWWNECHLELCSIVLPGYPQSLDPAMLATAPAGWVDHTREHCLRYARAIIDIVVLVEQETSRDHPLVIYDHTVAHAVYLGLRVQLEIGGVDILDTRTKERFEMALHLVERTAKYFHSIALLVKEMRRMLDVYYNGPPPPNEATADDSAASTQLRRPETPPLPWFRRLKDIEAERQAQRHNYQNPDRIETVLLELLPDYSSYGMLGAWSGTPAYEGDGFYSHVGHLDLQDAWGQPMNEVNAVNAVDAAAVASAANSMHTMGAMPGAAAATFHQPHPHPSAFAEPGGPRASSGATGMPMMDYHLDDDLLPNVVSLPPTAVGGPFFLPSGGYQ